MITLLLIFTIAFALIAIAFPERKEQMWKYIVNTWKIFGCVILALIILGVLMLVLTIILC